jgi:Zn-dependent protease with chaperone function
MTSRIISLAQIALSVVFLVGYFGVLAVFLLGFVKTPVEWKEALIALLGVITGSVLTIVGFWFSRSREREANS